MPLRSFAAAGRCERCLRTCTSTASSSTPSETPRSASWSSSRSTSRRSWRPNARPTRRVRSSLCLHAWACHHRAHSMQLTLCACHINADLRRHSGEEHPRSPRARVNALHFLYVPPSTPLATHPIRHPFEAIACYRATRTAQSGVLLKCVPFKVCTTKPASPSRVVVNNLRF